MFLLDYLWNHWFLIAFLAPFFFAVTNILDVYFVDGIYEDEWDGALISSFFQVLPWLLLVFGYVPFHYPTSLVLFLSLFGGACLTMSFFFYFKALFTTNDMVVVQALWSLSIPFVPFLAWFIVDEKLTPVHYMGIALAFCGALIFSFNKEVKVKQFNRVFFLMLGSVFFSSLAMVLQEQVYLLSGANFWTGFLLFSAGATLMGGIIFMFDHKTFAERTKHIFKMSKRFFFIFILAESLSLFAVLVSQRAIDLSPAVSFVVVIESLQPGFVMLLSFFLVIAFLFFNKSRALNIYRDQLSTPKTKIIACCIIAAGIYLIS